MSRYSKITIALLLVTVLLMAGCVKRYVVTTHLTQPLEESANTRIGTFSDDLPIDMKAEDKPSMEDIAKFKNYIIEEINDKGLLIADLDVTKPRYEVVGSIFEFKKGSGALRFFIGFGAGKAKLVAELKLVDMTTGKVLFAGNFKSETSSWSESGEKIFRQIAQDFAKELEKQQSKINGM